MKREELDLSFLYKIDPHRNSLYDGPELPLVMQDLDSKEALQFFFEECSLADMVYVILKSFKDQYPNDIDLSYSLSETIKYESGERESVEYSKARNRVDIDLFKYELVQHPEIDKYNYLKRLTINFKNQIDVVLMVDIIKEALSGKYFEEGDNGISVQDSPISMVSVKEKELIISINPSKVIYY